MTILCPLSTANALLPRLQRHRRLNKADTPSSVIITQYRRKIRGNTSFRIELPIADLRRERSTSKMLMGLISFQCLMDFIVAGFSLIIGLGIFSFLASILCSAAFFQNVKEFS
ncbi:hypothetical protein DM860_008296 [Cuscuta australis]|uniref:Uncharacterized protein n=1 Tax=Cuscuta australis TaxID=267555 RepID=A0A328D3S7_9ASTE|nr:hypothetical protein DM860_008296 [Cuscuta australis]